MKRPVSANLHEMALNLQRMGAGPVPGKSMVLGIPAETPWPTAEQVEQVCRKTGQSFRDLSVDEAITAVILAYKSNAAQVAG
jgi:hypothetical protein